jgi:gamma-glutamyltranspeptidase/glutathione hydrolase
MASEAGLEVLARGGNALEAAIAMTLCLGVVYPHFCGLGGDILMLIGGKSGKVRSLSGIGQAAKNYPPFDGPIPVRGPLSMLTSAGAVDALGQAFEVSASEMAGRMSWQALLEPAIHLATEGFPISISERFWLEFRKGESMDLPAVYPSRLANGEVPPEGFLRREPLLAKSLATLAKHGARDFYEGELAAAIADGLKMAGSPLSADDLKQTHARIEDPLQIPYREGVLMTTPAPTQGLTTLQIMGILDRFDLRQIPEGSAEYFHLLVEAVKLAFLDRERFVADPDCFDVPVEDLLNGETLQRKASHLDLNTAMSWPHPFQTGDTVYLAATDAQGHSVSMLATVYYDWGSGITIGDTGILWHNRGAAFSTTPGHPNFLQPGKRPFHTLNPGIYLLNGKPALLYGTQGADGQPQTLACILTRLIDYGLDPITAITRPRFLLGRTFSDSHDTLKIEDNVPEPVLCDLIARGHRISRVPANTPIMSHPGIIRIDPATGWMTGAHDPRSDGRALGL